MATVIGRGYNPSGSTIVHDDASGGYVSPYEQHVSSAPVNGSTAAGLAALSGGSASLFADLVRDSYGISARNSAEAQERAERQMEYQTESNHYAMNWSAQEAANNREWQERLANSAHQREVDDLLKAGLNPILSANHNGAATPSGGVGSGFSSSGAAGQVDFTNPFDILSNFFMPILNSATQMSLLDKEAAISEATNRSHELQAQISADASRDVAGTNYAATALRASTDAGIAEKNRLHDLTVTNLNNQEAAKRATQQNIWNSRNVDEQNQAKRDTSPVATAVKYANDVGNIVQSDFMKAKQGMMSYNEYSNRQRSGSSGRGYYRPR